MRVHFIAVGGAVMHNLAIELRKKGYSVTGSDDEIFEPSRSRLAEYGLLPGKAGWNPELITSDIDTVILGMHARADNPELLRAKELGLRIMSFPEYLFEQTRSKKRIVVAGSHGKTTTTALIMHVFKSVGIRFDYMVGSKIDGFDTMVGLSEDSEFAVLEGDEYLTSAIDPRPKFHLYMPDIAILNGIAWDHANVFPTMESYIDQFRIFIDKIPEGGTLIYFEGDPIVRDLALTAGNNLKKIPYGVHGYFQNKTGFYGATLDRVIPLKIFGEHNMQNLSAAKEACLAAGISEDDFYKAVRSFEGTSKRLQKISENEYGTVYLDFAHSPSKVKATVEAVASRYPGREIVACLELHTFSSLNIDFLPSYRGTLDDASFRFIYYNPHAVSLKRLSPLSSRDIGNAFGDPDIKVYDNSSEMFSFILKQHFRDPVFLFMSSGDYDGYNLNLLAGQLLKSKQNK
ncbi:MAG: Mur ligase family protein [Bacteroidales bacterium]|jgi:UDP-N-acetylmuramate: L-alanyl-gamma-D-glutamyl-meso-diaminopimelate ligase